MKRLFFVFLLVASAIMMMPMSVVASPTNAPVVKSVALPQAHATDRLSAYAKQTPAAIPLPLPTTTVIRPAARIHNALQPQVTVKPLAYTRKVKPAGLPKH